MKKVNIFDKCHGVDSPLRALSRSVKHETCRTSKARCTRACTVAFLQKNRRRFFGFNSSMKSDGARHTTVVRARIRSIDRVTRSEHDQLFARLFSLVSADGGWIWKRRACAVERQFNIKSPARSVVPTVVDAAFCACFLVNPLKHGGMPQSYLFFFILNDLNCFLSFHPDFLYF